MTLPTSRNRTYAAGTQLYSADLNDIQDHIVDNYYDDRRRFAPADGYLQAGSGSFVGGVCTFATASDVLIIPIRIKPSATIDIVRAFVYENGSCPMTLDVRKVTDGSGASLGTDTTSGAGTDTLEVSALSEVVPDLSSSLGIVYNAVFTLSAFVGTPNPVIYSLEVVTS